MSKKVMIIGAGFAGLSAAAILGKYKKDIVLTVLDTKEGSDFLPLLPDVLGRDLRPEDLTYSVAHAAVWRGFSFIKEEVIRVDLVQKKVFTAARELNYDYLLIASGSQTNFYADAQAQKSAFKLDNVYDTENLSEVLGRQDLENFVIAGAGYTGVEVAASLRRNFSKKKSQKRIIMVERAPDILGPLPQWMKEHVRREFKILGIEICTATTITAIAPSKVSLSNTMVLDNAALIWTAGVKTAPYIQDLAVEKNAQGRIKVDSYLRVNDSCFVAGDAAYFSFKESFLRMAVQFSIAQAECAAVNIIRNISGRPLKKYRPLDLGFILPLANNHSCGKVFGINVTGGIATFLHFMMCVYRSWGLKNKAGIIRGLLKGGW
jgi:NADH dehydrogenase